MQSSEYVDVEAVAQVYEVTPASVRSWCRKGVIKGAIRAGRKWKIPRRYVVERIDIVLPSEAVRVRGSK